MLNKTNTWSILIYGLIILSFGYLGYVDAGSKASLWAGTILGTLLIFSAIALFAGRVIGAYVALGATALLAGVFSYRYSLSGRGLPAALAVLSAGMLIFLLIRLANWKKS